MYSLGLAALVLWAVWKASSGPQLPALPFNAVFAVLVLGAVASWATWHYLGWRDSRE
ncbi:hypothetical protein [Deinococcus lacus]|uniref:hypothetical protein n=1 Tax=Deinococcus lacus TaxID=392561 RepID=UPI0036D32C11